MKMEKKVFIMKKRNFVLKYVSLFIKDFQSIGGNKFCFSDFNDLASINSIDSCLDAGTSPTSISFPLSYQNDLVDNLIKKKEFIDLMRIPNWIVTDYLLWCRTQMRYSGIVNKNPPSTELTNHWYCKLVSKSSLKF